MSTEARNRIASPGTSDGWEPGATVAGRFVVEGRLAVGGMGEIYLAQMQLAGSTRRRVALKRIKRSFASDRSFAAMFLEEARIASQLTHSGVVTVLDAVEADGELFLVLEYVPGWDLTAVLRAASQKSPFVVPIGVVAYVARSLASTLAYVHQATDISGKKLGIVHRDISPSNILLAHDGGVRLLDFGVAKASGRTTGSTAYSIKGKFSYMAPEQARGQQVDRRTDLYALGLVLFEMLTLQRAIRGSESQSDWTIARTPRHEPPSNKRPEAQIFDEVVARLLESTRERRPESASELVASLAALRIEGATSADLTNYVKGLLGSDSRPRSSSVSLPQEGRVFDKIDLAVAVAAGLDLNETQTQAPVVGSTSSRPEDAVTTLVAPRPSHREITTFTSAPTTPAIERLRSRGRPAFAFIAMFVLAAAGVLGWFALRTTTGATTSHVGARAIPPSAQPSNPAPPGPAPLEPEPPTSLSETDVPSAPPQEDPSITRTNARAVGKQTSPVAFGSLDVGSRPWTRILVDGRLVAESTPVRGIRLPAGRHTVTMENSDANLRTQRRVLIRPGVTTRLFVDLTTSAPPN